MKIVAILLFVAIVFFNIIGLPSNIMNRVFSQDLVVRYGLTDKELEARNFVTRDLVAEYGGILGSDSYYVAYIQSDVDWYWPQRTKVRDIDQYILKGNFNDCPYGIIILRESLYKEPFAFGNGSIYKVEYNPIELAKKHGYNEIWSNGEITCLGKK
jgi:hypothetical protein